MHPTRLKPPLPSFLIKAYFPQHQLSPSRLLLLLHSFLLLLLLLASPLLLLLFNLLQQNELL